MEQNHREKTSSSYEENFMSMSLTFEENAGDMVFASGPANFFWRGEKSFYRTVRDTMSIPLGDEVDES